MDVMYLDFCGYLSTHRETIELLFTKRVINPVKTLIHVTLCKREGTGTMDDLHLLMAQLCKAHYGRAICFRQAAEHSSTMWKGVFVVGRALRLT